MPGGVLYPGQVLHLVAEEQPVGPRPLAAVDEDLPEIEPEHPDRDRGERCEGPELEEVDSRSPRPREHELVLEPRLPRE